MNYNQHNFYKNNRDCAEAQVDISYKQNKWYKETDIIKQDEQN